MNTLDNFFNSSIYANMHPKKKAVIRELISNIKDKKPDECIPYVLKANASLRKMNMTFSKEESAQIFLLLTADMTPERKKQLSSFFKIV